MVHEILDLQRQKLSNENGDQQIPVYDRTLIMKYVEQLDKEKQLPDWITFGTALELYKTNQERFRGMMHAGKHKQKGHHTISHIDVTISDSIQLFNKTISGSPASSRTCSRTQQKNKTVQHYSINQYRHIKTFKQHRKSSKKQSK